MEHAHPTSAPGKLNTFLSVAHLVSSIKRKAEFEASQTMSYYYELYDFFPLYSYGNWYVPCKIKLLPVQTKYLLVTKKKIRKTSLRSSHSDTGLL